MILREKILAQLEQKYEQFLDFDRDFEDEAVRYSARLKDLAQWSSAELTDKLQDIATPGALPTAEFDAAPGLQVPFPHQWNNHQEARAWACEVLLNHPTVAVDGSQIKPDQDYSLPIAAVQVAWFLNHHTRDGRYVKDTVVQVLSPKDLLVELNGEKVVSEQTVNACRFELEVATLCARIEELAAQRSATSPLPVALPVALFDSSLVISFADRLQEEMRDKHVKAMLRLLRCSRDAAVPVVGYVDASRARDLVHMLKHCFDLNDAEKLQDAQLINALLPWGGRTPMFVCARGGADQNKPGVLESFGSEFKRGIGFVYLKASATAPPARLEIPLWVYEQGLLDSVLDIVRAEIIVGNGYPYIIEAADAAAVITARDREAFYALFQRFAQDRKMDLRLSQKAASKARRR
ncbi:MAG: DNA double-strand break repair nuclease NurA [Acidobacteriota bacterium]